MIICINIQHIFLSIAPTVSLYTNFPSAESSPGSHIVSNFHVLLTFKIWNSSSALNVFNGIFKECRRIFFHVISLNLYFSNVLILRFRSCTLGEVLHNLCYLLRVLHLETHNIHFLLLIMLILRIWIMCFSFFQCKVTICLLWLINRWENCLDNVLLFSPSNCPLDMRNTAMMV